MKHLTALYDMALVIGGEDRLKPLLDKTLKRLVYHTGYPVGLFLLKQEKSELESDTYLLASTIGDYRLKKYLDQPLQLPSELVDGEAQQLEIEPQLLTGLPVKQDYYHATLRLPVPDEGVIILLSPEVLNREVPYSTLFLPIMANLTTAIRLCRSNEAYTQNLINDRDQALTTNARFRMAMDTSSDCMFLIEPEEMRFIDFNKTAEEVLDYSREELLSMGPHDIKPHYSKNELHNYFETLLQGPQDFGIIETIHKGKHGQSFEVEVRLSVLRLPQQTPLIIAVARDISARKEAEESLYREKERAQVTLKSIGDGVITTDPRGRIEFLNPVAEQLTGWSTAEALGKPLSEVFQIINEDTHQKVSNPVERCLRENRIVGLGNHTILINRGGEEIAIEDSAAPIRDTQGNIIGVVLVFHDVRKARKLARELTWHASHDPLTRLYNRREFEERLEAAFAQSKRENVTHTLLYIDLDQFKLINDTCGHIAGDQLLLQLSAQLKRQVRENDTLARLGGDEFGVLLKNCNTSQALRLAETLRKTVNKLDYLWEQRRFKISASIGIVEINSHIESTAQIMSNADVACYAAKDNGGNRSHIYQPDDNELAQRQGEMQWVSNINDALENNHFELYAQPIAPIITESPHERYELLIRMISSDGGIIPPGSFIPAAERYKLMYRVDQWVINEALWLFAEHSSAFSNTIFSINLSGFSLTQKSLLDYIKSKFDEYQVPYQNFCFEITETAAITNLSTARDFMHELKKLGCSFALDDFGSGLSSFAYLKSLPVDYLKIDGSFIKDILDDPIDASMVAAINTIGHEMGLTTVAEFVESMEIMLQLKEIGVDYAQGFCIGEPAPLKRLYGPNPSSEHAMMIASSLPHSEG